MSIDEKTVAHVAKLARIRLAADELPHYACEISGILKWIEQLQQVNTEGVEPMTSVAALELPWREDKVTDGHKRDAIVQNAPASEYGCFVVPKVIDAG